MLELNKFNLTVEELQTPLERWCYFFKHGASLDLDHLPATLDFPMIRKAVEVLMRISETELEHQRYLERQRIERDTASWAVSLRMAQEKAQQAQEEARLAYQKGVEKGEIIGRIQLLQQFLKQTAISRAELNFLPEEQLLQLEDSLKKQLSGPKEANGTPPTDKT